MRKNDRVPAGPTRALIACVAISLVLLVLKPVPGGRRYEYALILALALTAIWFLFAAPAPDRSSGKRRSSSSFSAGSSWGP